MIIADMQMKSDYSLVPFSPEAKDLLKNFKPNQIVKVKVSGVKKERSVIQLRLFWACCRTVADNTEDESWNTPDKVCIQIKIALKFFKSIIVTPDNHVHFDLDSISFENLSQVNANKIFDRSWPIMAKKIGVSVDTLLQNAEAK
ncbi:MAG: hypothetical protein DRH26_14525 [Deltaproteobacteria bacterium]|nr:MAG: hypothetical protein DRH26_14525 [Deltaproteobacteria bacterium]